MLTPLLEELAEAELGGITTLVNRELDINGITADEIHDIDGGFFAAVKKRMESANVVWIIAPECGGALYRLTDMAERMGKKVAGSSTDAVKLCGDKLSLARYMDGKIETPESVPFTDGYDDFPCVVKSVDGAGSENIHFVNDNKSLRQIKIDGENLLVQPYVEGTKLSAGIVNIGDTPVLLGICRQETDVGQSLKPKRIVGPVEYANSDKLIGMIKKINRLIPGLRGYYGIDFIDNNGRITLIEINPRLTASYPVYVKSCGFNIAESLLRGMTQTLKAV